MSSKRTAHARILIAALTIVAMSALASTAGAQTVVDATTAEFEPSPDHSAVSAEGTPLLTFYLLEFFPAGSSTPSHTIDLGKPVPAADGYIRVAFVPLMPAPLVAGTIYQARISAVGPGGRGTSELSNSFANSAACAPVLSAQALPLGAAASTGTVTVTAGTTCEWSAVANTSWLTITSPAEVTGNGTVAFAAAANTAATPRTGTLTIAGQTVTITQGAAGAPCAPVLSATSASVAATISTGSITVTDGATCVWTASANNSWLSITSAMPMTGSNTVNYRAAANSSTSPRTGTLTIAGRTVTITQAGAVPSCSYAINPASRTFPAAGETATVAVTAASGCAWTASSALSWVTVTAGASGSGNGNVSVRVAPHSAATQRTGNITIAGRTFAITQTGTCTFSVTPGNITAPAAGMTGTLSISTSSSCSWSVSGAPSWITSPSGTRTGSGNLTLTVSVNAGAARSATVTVAGRPVAINQGAATVPSPTNFRIIRTQADGQQ